MFAESQIQHSEVCQNKISDQPNLKLCGNEVPKFVVEVELERKMNKNSNPVNFVNSEWHLCEGSAPLEHLRQEQMEMQRDIDQNQICAD